MLTLISKSKLFEIKSPLKADGVGVISQRVHLFPFRTQKLSSAEAKILVWRRTGKIAHRQHRTAKLNIGLAVSVYVGEFDCGAVAVEFLLYTVKADLKSTFRSHIPP